MRLARVFYKIVYRVVAICLIMPTFSKIVIKIYRTFRDSSVSFTLDTSYLNWNTTFPAVTVCEIYNGEKAWDISEEFFGVDRDHRIDDFVADIAFFSGKCESCQYCDEINCPDNLNEIIQTFRTECNELIKNCSWMGESFECCEEFKPLQTEYGMCFSFNSIQSESFHDHRRYINNRETGVGLLDFQVSEDVQVHIHPPNDIPYLMAEGIIRETVLWGSTKEIILNIVEMVNDAVVESLSPEHRKCRFHTEFEKNEKQLYRFYSFSTCIVECINVAYQRVCHWTNHFFPKNGNDSSNQICNVEGLKCLSENYSKFNKIRKDCDCLLSCEEPEYNVIYVSGDHTDDSTQSSVRITMIDLPTQRYVRNVAKTDLDLIISIGGIAGLFFGASLLSTIEILFKIYLTAENRTIDLKKFKKIKGKKLCK